MNPDANDMPIRPSAAANSDRPVVSIVIATYDRLSHLQRCIARMRANVSIAHETIVVAGETGDGTWDWLVAQPDLRLIREPDRQGAARAFDQGFRSAVGTYVMWLNDDSYPLSGAVEAAVRMIERPDLTDHEAVHELHDRIAGHGHDRGPGDEPHLARWRQ